MIPESDLFFSEALKVPFSISNTFYWILVVIKRGLAEKNVAGQKKEEEEEEEEEEKG